MAKRRRRSRGGGGGCCPRKIVLKCKLKRSAYSQASAGPSLSERLAKFKAAELRENSRLGGLGKFPGQSYGPYHAPGKPISKAARKAAAAAKHAGTCSVKFGGRATRRMNPVKAAAYIRSIVNKQRAKGCVPPTVSRG